MKNFDKMFAQAVRLVLEEKGKKEEKKSVSAKDIVVWGPGPGNWGDVIKGIKEDAHTTYDEAIAKTSATGGKAMSLMGKLGVTKPAKATDPLEAANEILQQAVTNAAMADMFGQPVLSKTGLTVPVNLPMDPESIKTKEGVLPRNATVWIHLTLLGAINSNMFRPGSKLKIETASPKTGEIVIRKI